MERPCFHLSIPAIDLQRSHDWYVLTLGCRPGRRSDQAAILDFEGHQLVLQSTPWLEELPQVGIYPRHFGLVFASWPVGSSSAISWSRRDVRSR